MINGEWTPRRREDLKQLVAKGEIRLMLGTDVASEGLNLQRLGSLINLDLPWNPPPPGTAQGTHPAHRAGLRHHLRL